MERYSKAPRRDWSASVESIGLTYHTHRGGSPYWDESAYWEFSSEEIDRLAAATAEIHRLALSAVPEILSGDLFERMQIPAEAASAIQRSWESQSPVLYGRMDLAYDGHQVKLLEYNADTPTALVEAAVAQWYWLEECFPNADQFNSIHGKLVAKWRDLAPYVANPMHFAHDGGEEDAMTVTYLRDTAQQAGLRTVALGMHEIGWDEAHGGFVDLNDREIRTLFKLYPWEWLLEGDFGSNALATMGRMQWLEPIWKMLWSNKALLAVLWELNPGHELLLPAYLDGPRKLRNYVRKPLFGREGEGVSVFRDGAEEASQPVAKSRKAAPEKYVWQELAPMAQADDVTAVFGSWLIDGEPAGMGIRESTGPITNNSSRFVPHLFR